MSYFRSKTSAEWQPIRMVDTANLGLNLRQRVFEEQKKLQKLSLDFIQYLVSFNRAKLLTSISLVMQNL